ncbi:ribonuclease HII [Bacillus tianshenii]|nr:ribonuclease HII [Bacillus tianshenii]
MKPLTIKEIEQKLFNEGVTAEELETFQLDKRKGVQRLLARKAKHDEEAQRLRAQYEQMLKHEVECRNLGHRLIAGIDEVGRGPLAGPVTAAAVILGEDTYIAGLNDSKALSESKREALYEEILEKAVAVSVETVSAEQIDELNIYQAAKLAMKQAVVSLQKEPHYLLVDAMEIPLPIPQRSIIKGDANSVSIAAASIVAKVTRDRYMKKLAEEYPDYHFDRHMGYGTKAHLEALERYGITREHRRSFSPVRKYCQ